MLDHKHYLYTYIYIHIVCTNVNEVYITMLYFIIPFDYSVTSLICVEEQFS